MLDEFNVRVFEEDSKTSTKYCQFVIIVMSRRLMIPMKIQYNMEFEAFLWRELRSFLTQK